MPKHHPYGPVGVHYYHHRGHLLFTFFLILLPFIFVLLIPSLGTEQKQAFLADLAVSTWRLFVAYFLSVALATLAALLLSRGKLGNFFVPLFDVLQSLPTFAVLPLAVHFFGANDRTVILFLIITIIWPILFAIISSLKLVRPDWEEAAVVFGATGWRRIVYFALPVSFPGIITGSIVGLGEGWEAVVGTEIIIGLDQGGGLGSFFNAHGQEGHLVFFGVMTLLLLIFVINKLLWLPLLEKSHLLLTE
jgi:NitT/TauT family transport system permease protein